MTEEMMGDLESALAAITDAAERGVDADLTPAEEAALREMCEDSDEWFRKLAQPSLLAGTSGTMPCRQCSGNASWERIGSDWTIECECGWSAAGMLASNDLPKN